MEQKGGTHMFPDTTDVLLHPGALIDEEPQELVPTPEDPFPYGWRYITIQRNGEEELLQVPLTLDDVLHPEEEDYVIQLDEHFVLCKYLYEILHWWLQEEPQTVVVYDMLIDWNKEGIRPHAPDVTVLRGVQKRPQLTSYRLRETGGAPVLAIEVTSSRTRQLDVQGLRTPNKFQHYARVGIPIYVIVDLAKVKNVQEEIVPLAAYRLNEDGAYTPILPDAQGRLWLETVGLALGHDDGEVTWFDPDGRVLQSYNGVVQAYEAEHERADAEHERADAEHERADAEHERADAAEQRAETAEQQVEAERQRAEAERQRAETAEQRAETERQRAEEAAERIRQLEAELRRRNGEA
jgi:Uma2 family endonuclease